MKRGVLKTVAVIAAFFIGVSINQSCGESDPSGTPSAEVMWNTVQALTSEVAQLKQEVAALKAGGNGSGGGSGEGSGVETLVDGLYISRSGFVASKIKEQIYYESDGKVSQTVSNTYDEHGRIKTYKSLSDTWIITAEYNYSGKEVTYTSTMESTDTKIGSTSTTYRTTYY